MFSRCTRHHTFRLCDILILPVVTSSISLCLFFLVPVMSFYNCSCFIPHKGEDSKRLDTVEGLVRRFDNHEVQIDKDIRQLNAAFHGIGGSIAGVDVLSELEKSVMKLESSKADKVRTNIDF